MSINMAFKNNWKCNLRMRMVIHRMQFYWISVCYWIAIIALKTFKNYTKDGMAPTKHSCVIHEGIAEILLPKLSMTF